MIVFAKAKEIIMKTPTSDGSEDEERMRGGAALWYKKA